MTAQTVVYVTQMALERDSRTLKHAGTLARAGYRVVVVEGERSSVDLGDLPIELITVPGAQEPGLELRSDGSSVDAPSITGRTQRGKVGSVAAAAARPVLRAWTWLRYLSAPRLRYRLWQIRWWVRWNVRTYRAIPRAQLLIVRGYFLAPAVMAAAGIRRGTRYAYEADDAYFEVDPAQLRDPGFEQRVWQRVERRCVRGADRFVTVSEGVAGMLEERFGRRPEVIRNCHDLRLDRPSERDLRAELDLPEDHFLLVFTGNHKAGLVLEQGLQALRQLPSEVHLALVGLGHERNLPRISALGLEGRAHVVRPVPPREVARFIEGGNASVILYRAYTRNYAYALPNGLFQSLAAGLPVLYPRELSEVAALVEQHRAGISFDPADPGSIAVAVRELLEDPARRAELAENAAEAGRAESWEREEARLAGYVRSALPASVREETPA